MGDVQQSMDEIELADVQISSKLTQNNKRLEFTNWLKNFPNIDDALEYVNSNDMINELANTGDGIKIRLCMEENFSSFSANNLQRFLKNFSSKAIVMLFASKSSKSFSLFWKSKDIDYFLVFKPPERKTAYEIKELYGFIACCLALLLCDGQLGIKIDHQHSKDLNEISLEQLADKDGFDILKLCAEAGDVKCMELLLSLNIFQDNIRDLKNAQSRAQFYEQFDVLLLLLRNNYSYPKYLNEDQYPEDLRNFVKIGINLHEAVKLRNFERITEIIELHPIIRHFYNTKNESVLKIALKTKHFDIYEHLLLHDLILGPHENITDIYAAFSDTELTTLREIHFRCKKDLTERHLEALMMNTSISHDDTEKEGKEKLVLRAYSVLNKDPQINPILKAVAASKRFTIVFDFKRISVSTVDPTASKGMRGVFYPDRKICIGALQLLDPATEHETFGTLAHELCHYAMFLIFKNRAKPYAKHDHKTKEEYKRIVQYCMVHREQELIISLAFSYESNMYSAELIVRVVHLLAMYHNQPEKLQELREIYPSLFKFHSDVVIPAVNKALPGIKAKAEKEIKEKDKKISNLSILLFISVGLGIVVACLASFYFYKPVYKFDELNDSDKRTVRNGLVRYKNEIVMLSDLFPKNSSIYHNITSDHILHLLNKKVLNFDDDQLRYLDTQIIFTWENLTEKLRKKFLNSNLTFQGEVVKFRKLFESHPNVFDALVSNQIVDVLSGRSLTIGQKFEIKDSFYLERKFIFEDTILIAFEYLYGYDYVLNETARLLHCYERLKVKVLREIYDEISKLSFDELSEFYKKIKANNVFKVFHPNLNNKNYHFMYKNSADIIERAEIDKILILSSEAGAGKTATFEQLSLELKAKFPTRWVLYIDLPIYMKLYKNNPTVENLLKEIVGLDQEKGYFEVRFFEESFKTGNLVLIWNGFDEISPIHNNFTLNVLKFIYRNTKNIQLVCTRPLYSEQLRKEFKVRTWQLLPFDEMRKQDFLRKFFISENVLSNTIEENVHKVGQIILKLNFCQFDFAYKFETPLMLKLLAGMYNDPEYFDSGNTYGIYKAFVEKKLEIWLEKNKNSFSLAKKLLYSGSLKTIFQKYALLNEFHLFSSSTLALKIRKLQIMHKELPNDFPIEDISQLGILFINEKNNFQFSHKTLSEFFVAQYFVENIFDIDGDVNSDEAELRLELFFRMTKIYGDVQKIITDFMSSYLEMRPKNPKKFNPTIRILLRTKFRNFFIRFLDTNYPKVFEFLFEFFKPDHELIVDLLHVHQNETLFTATFNPNNFALFTNPTFIIDLAQNCLTTEEIKKFKIGKNQIGKVLYGFKFYNLLHNVSNSLGIDQLKSPFYWDFFPEVRKRLEPEEKKELFVAALSPKIYFYYDKMFNTDYFFEYEKLWTDFENLLTKTEMQNALGDALLLYFEIYPETKINHEKFLNLLIEKCKKFLSSSQIFEMFLSKNILHEAHSDLPSFIILWDFLSNHTNKSERKQILLKDDFDDKNFYFWMSFDEGKSMYSTYQYPFVFYECTPFKIIHRALNVINAPTFDIVKEIYKSHFHPSEIQEIIFSSNDFIYYAIELELKEVFEKLILYLEDLFKGNEKKLKEFLERNIKPTTMSVFEFVSDFTVMPLAEPKWHVNLEALRLFFNKLGNGTKLIN